MAGARLGYLVADPEVVGACELVALPYHLDTVTQLAGRLALDYADEMNARVAAVAEERGRIAAAFADLPVETWPSDANFILFRPTGREAGAVWADLVSAVGARARLFDVAGARRVPAGDGGPPRGERPVPGRPDRKPAMSTAAPDPTTDPDRRAARVSRATKETSIEVVLDLDGTGATEVATGLPFFDHMLTQLGRHGGFDLTVAAVGDLDVDAHHTVEDVGHRPGRGASPRRSGDKAGITRFASISLPLDEALVDVALDLSGRPFLAYDIEFAPDTPGSAPRRSTRSWPRSSGAPS